MNTREWALIAFTILTQMSVGSLLVLGVVHFFAARKAGMEQADRLSDRALLAIVPVLVLAMLASLAHLGNPINAPRAVSNLGTSWLSREIFSAVVFVILAVVFAFMQWRKISTFSVRNVIAWIAALVGLVLVFSESMIYMLEAAPSWNTVMTPVSFFTTALLLGSLAMGAAYVANYAYVRQKDPECAGVQCELVRNALRWIAVVSIVMLGIQIVTLPIYLATLSTSGAAAGKSLSLLAESFGVVLGLRLVLVFLGAGIVGLFLFQNASVPGREKVLGYLAYSAFVLVFVAEVMGRFLFYATHIRIGV